MKAHWIAGAVAFGLLTIAGSAQQTPPPTPPPPDQTKADQQRDRDKNPPAADSAKSTMTDREVMQKIRKSVMDDKTLSSSAHNVKINAKEGKVTLKGAVTTAGEKDTIEKVATDVAGAGNVTNEITVKATDKDKSK